MFHRHLEDLFNVIVRERIKHFFPALSRLYEFALPKYPKLVRYRRLCHAEQLGYGDAEFGPWQIGATM